MIEKGITEGPSGWQSSGKISADICQSIIDRSKKQKFVDASITNIDVTKIDKERRVGKHNFNNQQWVYDLIWPYMEECNKGAEWGFDISSAESYQIAKYDVGDYYKPHLDSIGTQSTRWIAKDNSHLHNKTRKISMSLILNDGFEGGDLEIFGVPTPKLETGSMIFFPSFIAHEVTPVTKGTRHSLVMWFLGTPWR